MSTLIIFIFGYAAIIFEHNIKLNKAASALLIGVLCWTVYIMSANGADEIHHISENLMEHFSGISGILFFLLGVMTIVELVDAHDGFKAVTGLIKTQNTAILNLIYEYRISPQFCGI